VDIVVGLAQYMEDLGWGLQAVWCKRPDLLSLRKAYGGMKIDQARRLQAASQKWWQVVSGRLPASSRLGVERVRG